MEIVMLAAGTSSRMGKQNKLLLPYLEHQMACHCCLQALSYLETLDEKSDLIVVTGYRRASLEKSLAPCRDFIEKTHGQITMTIVENKNYRLGQFSSTKVGVSQIPEGKEFLICLADMPKLQAKHFKELTDIKNNCDCIRPFVGTTPGHPVLLSSNLRDRILKEKDTSSVREILLECKVFNYQTSDRAFIQDCDTPEAFASL